MHIIKTILAILLTTAFITIANAEENKYHLTINVIPSDAKIRVMNIKPKYQHGIMLKSGKYDVKVTRSGYESKRWWIEIEATDLTVDVVLNKLGTKKNINSNKDDVGNFALWEYALQLRKSKPDLFAEAQGVLLLKIEADSQAEKRGLRSGDIIIAYAGQKINSISQLNNLIYTNADKKRVKLRFIRANTVKTVKLHGGKFGVKLATSITETFSLVEWFETEFLIALQQTQNGEKINQLFIDNPHLVELYQILLTSLVEIGNKEDAEWAGNMIKVTEEVFKNLYLPPSYLTVVQLFEESAKASLSGDNTKALKKLQLGLKKAQELNHQFYITQFLKGIGLFHYTLEQYQKSLEYFEKASIASRDIDNINIFGDSLYFIGGIYKNWGQYSNALEYYQRALAIKHSIGDKFMESSCLTGLGIIYRDLGNYEKALEYLQQALTLDREFKDKRSEGSDLSDIGTVYYALSQYQKSLNYLEKALKIRRELGDKNGELTNLDGIGVVYQDLGEFQKALNYSQQAMKIAHDIGNKFSIGKISNNIGSIYREWKQYQTALDYYQKALAIYEQIDSTQIDNMRGKAIALSNIGIVYSNLDKTQEALEYLQQALIIDKKLSDKAGIGADLMNIGTIYVMFKQYTTALDYFHQSLKIMREINQKLGEANNLGNIANVYKHRGQYQKALDYYQQTLAIHQEIGSQHEIEKDLNDIRHINNKLNMPTYDNSVDQNIQNVPSYNNIFEQKIETNKNLNNDGISQEEIARAGSKFIAWFIIITIIVAIIGLITRVNHRKKQASEIASEVKQKFGK
ncbi:tetratricopeptide repeat protein [Candidatus Halobeggiatoa sp. HSG11]|nr:tetratricopeptide repeat protein [Candidatus Halobeggiatoa sp. HSG11]